MNNANHGSPEEGRRRSAPRPTDHEAAAALFRAIRDDISEKYSAAEKINAVKALAVLTGDDSLAGQGPGSMTRAEIQSELARVRRLLDGEGAAATPVVRQSVRRSKAK